MTNDNPKYDIGEEVTIKYKGMDIPAKIAEKRTVFGRWDYKLELLDDGEQTSEWIQESSLERYNK